ncbi:PLP-dependent aminotransferase family protein [Aurantimonas sp. HBX-1]|uniref:aminotransferase-like domain-containing protein n=1 Tax=Aurantimonas sp. HBX-1 TaxID=2906072 RepID=UPI001F48DA3C|nr:PLP-dependent aminotransferase family protein [Aurantimonas sp. HBX-1]UIJ72626.1 PLP-dependent aminotransferase family protein [Aurantimonas sp. HBX-1]
MALERTRVAAIVETVSANLLQGAYKIGERLPSVRRAAQAHGVSKNTMAEAYDQLVAQGLLQARPGSGYYVSRRDLPQASTASPHLAAAIDRVSLLREQLDRHYEVRPGDGRPPASWMEGSELRRHFSGLRATGPDADDFGYGSVRGFAPLRERLRLMLMERSIAAAPDGVLLTHGANHAHDLIIRHLLEPGDTVLVDDPGYYPLFAKLALAKVRMIGVNRTQDGPDLDDLRQKLATTRPKLFFTQSQAHNPTGGSLSPPVAFGILQATEQWGTLVVENDAFADIVPPAMTRLAALDQLNRVIYVGTFSKTLSASLRCGFLAGHPSLVQPLTDIKMLTGVATSGYVERFVFNLIQGGQYLRHLRRLRSRVESANQLVTDELETIGLTVRPCKVPGFYLWAEFAEGIDENALCQAAAQESIFLAPGSIFSPNRSAHARAAIRVNVAYGADPRLLDFLRKSVR